MNPSESHLPSENKVLERLRKRTSGASAEHLLSLLEETHVKTALHRVFTPEDGFEHYRTLMHFDADWSIRPLRFVKLFEILKRAGSDFQIFNKCTDKIELPRPKIFGPGKMLPVARVPRTVAGGWLKNITLTGRSSALRQRNRMIFDHQGDELDRVPVELAFDPAVYQRVGSTLFVMEDRSEDRVVRLDKAVSMLGVNAKAFGHWTYELLPLLLTFRDVPALEGVPILVDEDIPEQHVQSVALFSAGRNPIIRVARRHRVEVANLYAVTSWFYNAHLLVGDHLGDDKVMRDFNVFGANASALGSLFEDAGRWCDTTLPADASDAKRLFIRRKPTMHRQLVNAEEVEACLRPHDFEDFYPEDSTFAEQVRRVRAADEVVCMAGSASHVMFFARPGTKFCLLSHAAIDLMAPYSSLVLSLGVDFKIVTGNIVSANAKYRDRSDYAVSVDRVAAILSEWRNS